MTPAARVIGAALGAFLLVAGGVLFAPALKDPEADSYRAEGYVEAVRIIVDNGWLVAGEGDRIVDVTEEARRARAFRRFYENSFLKADIARNEPGLWVIDSVLIGASPFAHVVASPFARPGWQGDLTVDQPAGGPELTRPGGAVLAMRPLRFGAPEAPVSVDAFDPSAGGDGTTLRLFAGDAKDSAAHLADVRLVGDAAVLSVGALGPQDEIRLDGETLPTGAVRPMNVGSRLVLRRGERRGVFMVRGGASGAISVAQPLGGRRRNARLERLAQTFERAMDAVVARSPEARDRDFVSTLDIDAHQRVQDRLERTMAGSASPAAVTVMDALDGDVLVLASAPSPPAEVSPLVARASLRDRDVVNYNFQPLAVGSAAKPLVAAAILAENDGLADLQVLHQGAGPMERLLGIGFSGEAKTWPTEVAAAGPGEWLTLERFLAVSSNRYAGSLSLLGWSPDPLAADGAPAGGDHRFGPAPAERLPRLDVQVEQTPEGRRFGPAIRAPAWRRRLPALFDMGACHGAAGCRDDLWRAAFGEAPGLDRRPPAQFLALSPQDKDFGFRGIRDFRSQYLPIMLGGEAYGWSAVTLAQSYARLVTGSKVRARLLRDERRTRPLPEALPLNPAVRARLREGLRRVVGEGTGRPLAPVLAEYRAEAARRGESVDFYAKTGTPEIERLAYTRQEEAENRLIRGRVIAFRDGRMVVAGVAPVDEASRARALARLRADADAMRLLNRSSAGRAVGRALAYNTATPQGKAGYYRLNRGRVTAVVPRGQADPAFASALALVVVVREAGAGEDARPLRAFSIAVNLQEPGRAAMPLASAMLREDLRRLVFPAMAPSPEATP